MSEVTPQTEPIPTLEEDAAALLAWQRYCAADRFARARQRVQQHALIERGRELAKGGK